MPPLYLLLRMRFPRDVRRFASVFTSAGYELYVVGGAVRDRLLGRDNLGDYDFATNATPEEVMALFKRVIPTGIRHGTVTVRFSGHNFEVTTYRVDGTYTDMRRPDQVHFTRSLADDLSRRDFTVNALAVDPESGQIIDRFGGRSDLRRRIIRAVGDPMERFQEDALRMVRAVRFASQLDFEVEEATLNAVSTLAPNVQHVAIERVTQELDKMMTATSPSTGWNLLRRTGLLERLIPELTEDRRRHLPMDVFSHLTAACDFVPPTQVTLRWAALLHDVAKPECYQEDERGIHFHGHDQRGAEMAADILQRLRMPRARIEKVSKLIREHMFGYTRDWSDAAVRRLIARVGRDSIHDLITLRRADTAAKLGTVPADHSLNEAQDRIDNLIAEDASAFTRADLAVDGSDLMEVLDLKPGPAIGNLLDDLLETVLADPSQNTRDQLLAIAAKIAASRYYS